MIAHLAGFVHGACSYEGTVPVELRIGDFPPVADQSVDASEKDRKQHSTVLHTEFIGVIHVLYSVCDEILISTMA